MAHLHEHENGHCESCSHEHHHEHSLKGQLWLIIAALGIATMWLAVFADVGEFVTVLAVLNAMRALKN